MWFHLARRSANAKTGPMPVSTSSTDTCPLCCPLKGGRGCYAESGPLSWFWRKIRRGKLGVPWRRFLSEIRALPMDQIWRHNQAGDLPGIGDEIDRRMLRELVLANRGKRGFTFSHKPLTAKNAAAIRAANGAGFTINVSADNLSEADEFIVRSVGPVVVLLPEEARFHPKRHASTPAGNRIVVCPAERADLESRRITCKTCQLCAVVDRKTIVGFPAHGGRKNRVSALASASSPDFGDKRSLSHRIF